MSSELPENTEHSRATIMAELAAVLRESDVPITNMESVVARTSVPMQQISTSFGSTRELLLAMVSELSDSMSAPLALGSAELDVRQRLLDFGERVTDVYATSHLRGLYRIAITESIRHTDLGQDFYEVGPGRLTQRLADFLQAARVGGSPQLLASHFLSLLRTSLYQADTFPHGPAIRRVAGREDVRNAVDLFCAGINGARQLC
jgi:hypothetical protein